MSLTAYMPRSKLAIWSRRGAFISLSLILFALVLHRLGRMETPIAMGLVLAGLVAAGIALLSGMAAGVIIWRQGAAGAWSAVAGVALSLAIFAWPLSVVPFYLKTPPLSDITTDLENPPEFVTLAQTRPPTANAATYRGESLAKLQEQHYPELRPMIVERAAEEVFDAAGEAVRRLRWRIAAEEPPRADGAAGHIEAQDRTLILGFTDDVVVRVENDGGTTRVDVRSQSRYGRHDFGRNASRIKEFYAELQARLDAAVPATPARGRAKARAKGPKAPVRQRKGDPARGQAPRK